jgi:AcrR family transcriptional regulator
MTAGRSPGRPRSEAVRTAILDAALAELRTRGYAGLTIEGIAERAGAGKQTVYRWWSSKADVVLDAMLSLATTRIKVPDSGSLEQDLREFLRATFRQRSQRPILIGLMAEALLNPGFHAAFRERFLFSRRAVLHGILQRAADRAEIAGSDFELIVDVVFGVLWYRLMLDHAPVNDALAEELVALIMAGLASG